VWSPPSTNHFINYMLQTGGLPADVNPFRIGVARTDARCVKPATPLAYLTAGVEWRVLSNVHNDFALTDRNKLSLRHDWHLQFRSS